MAHVLIVGAGMVGLAVAEELTRRGVRVDLFERGREPAREASWAAAGILSPLGGAQGPGPMRDLLRWGCPLIFESAARVESSSGMETGRRTSGMLALAFSPEDERELEREWTWHREAGLNAHRIGASSAREMEPAIDGPVRSALWFPQAAQVDNTLLGRAYWETVRRQGGILHAGVAARRFLIRGDRVIGLETSEGKVEADWVVNCAGSWAGFDDAVGFPIPVIPAKGQLLQYETPAPVFNRMVHSSRAYFVQRSPGWLIAGTTVEYVGWDTAVTEEARRSIERGAAEISSRIRGLSMETSWAGLRPDTPDHLPILGPTPLKNLLMAAGHFRSGILLAPLTGRIIADWITTGSSPVDLTPFSVTRFQR